MKAVLDNLGIYATDQFVVIAESTKRAGSLGVPDKVVAAMLELDRRWAEASVGHYRRRWNDALYPIRGASPPFCDLTSLSWEIEAEAGNDEMYVLWRSMVGKSIDDLLQMVLEWLEDEGIEFEQADELIGRFGEAR